MDIQQLARGNKDTWKWATDWEAQGSTGAKMLRKTAAQIKDRYEANGLWNPDAKIAHDMLMECAQNAEAKIVEDKKKYARFRSETRRISNDKAPRITPKFRKLK